MSGAATFSLPCTCVAASSKFLVWSEKDVLSQFLGDHIHPDLFCHYMLPLETYKPRRKGSEGHWLLELRLKSDGPLTGEEDFVKSAARALSGVVEGYGTNAALLKIRCSHFHPGHAMCGGFCKSK